VEGDHVRPERRRREPGVDAGGGGCLAELWSKAGRHEPPPLEPGDVVTMRIEGIGEIANRVVEGAEPAAVPKARRRG
jgi:hypothetical protein